MNPLLYGSRSIRFEGGQTLESSSFREIKSAENLYIFKKCRGRCLWGAYRVGLLIGDVELVDMGPEHGFFAILRLLHWGLGELRGHFIFYPQPPRKTSSNSIPI